MRSLRRGGGAGRGFSSPPGWPVRAPPRGGQLSAPYVRRCVSLWQIRGGCAPMAKPVTPARRLAPPLPSKEARCGASSIYIIRLHPPSLLDLPVTVARPGHPRCHIPTRVPGRRIW